MKRTAAGLAVAALFLVGCTSESDQPEPAASPAESADPTGAGSIDEGFSTPVEDGVYPDIGDPGVDALHYRISLGWHPDSHTLDAVETLRFRATTDADHVQLDLGEPMDVESLTVDGEAADFEHDGKNLVVDLDVAADQEYTAVLHYSGKPRPVPAPVRRTDFSSTGWTVTKDDGAWTMQEPYGAYSWYAVNDQPSDKALYDITVRAPAPMVGVSNGELRSQRTVGDTTVSTWRLDEPAASYLVTVAIGDFVSTEDDSSDVPITYWTPRGRDDLVRRLGKAPAGMDWLEDKLGPFPFDSLGFLVVDSASGMETQTMITLGDNHYATSPAVLVHEMAHQWYGDRVTPVDWRDVWMNEGMAMYLQGVWTSDSQGTPLEDLMDEWATYDESLRSAAGPPADYDPEAFGDGNVYYIPAVMWDELRKRVGDDRFWSLVRKWPETHDNQNADYDEITDWWSDQTGEDLTDFFDTWLLSDKSPSAVG